ncbi:short-chain dehydrogenase [Curtobacterium sp. MCBD17_034]|uniref:SDR family NAD(P)-dependent oxidoreductase n=1 Tax=unclassified Curtobacterium TaxID=257496 RepID=UPI000DAA2C5A|nr:MULTISPECIES: SDR family NAD(P)-dependent oxidoreductase [unclassified Curtobacterium]PZE78353.1 short-chain dehydrogenase [Curtobacterium sp. MCBD17_019]PZF62515.1 short-chain dehydrogenase [Curtobacterium sp. MCBD17_034]PZM39777.1 short-chain dehydrogenase [Curtobacterium sp. MCBD17_031]WIB64170.1 SDR family NAD(P)-dependent oxidoreductase [Curtobacterium sp. MCBD17_040]WIB67997.1 SDR family NAD(P)-dependent oxidoreductase [Curtobacterium sp. MCBD17_035]
MTTTLITGGNKGLGYTAAQRLRDLGHTVVIGSRDPERGASAAAELGVDWITIDVASDESVATAATEFTERFGTLDVLVNNAGIAGGRAPLDEVDGPAIAQVLDTNTVGPVRVVHAFLPLLRRSTAPVVVNVSSGLGSFAVRADDSRIEAQIPTLSYSASKAALNMLTTIYAKWIPEVRFNVVDPGYTATDLNGNSGHQTVEEGTDAIVAMATIGADGPTGTFVDRSGAVAW